MGIERTALNPPKGDFSSFISPPWLLAMSLEIVNPNPIPPVDRFLELSVL